MAPKEVPSGRATGSDQRRPLHGPRTGDNPDGLGVGAADADGVGLTGTTEGRTLGAGPTEVLRVPNPMTSVAPTRTTAATAAAEASSRETGRA